MLRYLRFTWAFKRYLSASGSADRCRFICQNAILIIEFAKERQDLGYSLYDSVTVAARQRLRPIIMTSLAFGIGVVPLFLATGAGSGSQNAIGTSVLGGVVSATILGCSLSQCSMCGYVH